MGLRRYLSQHRPSLRVLLLGSFFFLFGITVIGIGIGAYKITASQFLVKQTKDNLCAQTTLLAHFFSYDLVREAASRGIELPKIGVEKQAPSGAEPSTSLGCRAESINPTPLPPAPDPEPGQSVDPLFQTVGKGFSTTLKKKSEFYSHWHTDPRPLRNRTRFVQRGSWPFACKSPRGTNSSQRNVRLELKRKETRARTGKTNSLVELL